MICPSCQAENAPLAVACAVCGRALGSRPLGPGSLIAGRYEILGQIGAGGMGTVFRAHDRALDETVALKILRGAPGDPELASRFRSEVKLAWKVRHKNVCGIHEYGEDGDLLYISMELVEGRDLRQLLQDQGALAWEDACEVAVEIGEGLQAIHDEGVVHRDLKSANIMLDARGAVRLMDFGIAKVWGREKEDTPGITATGRVVGSPEYMSPEQIRGKDVDFRSDIYAMGIVLYEVFTGRVPFRATTPVETMMMHLQQDPPLEGPSADQIPAALVPVLRQALAKDPSERYPSCRKVIAALREARAALARQPTDFVSAARTPGAAPTPSRVEDERPPIAEAAANIPEARFLLAPLLKALEHADRRIRTEAAQALGRLGSDAPAAVAPLLKALEDDDAGVRAEAARALGLIGCEPLVAVPALRRAQEDTADTVRDAAAAAVARLAAKGATASPAPSPQANHLSETVAPPHTETLTRIVHRPVPSEPQHEPLPPDRLPEDQPAAGQPLASERPAAERPAPVPARWMLSRPAVPRPEAQRRPLWPFVAAAAIVLLVGAWLARPRPHSEPAPGPTAAPSPETTPFPETTSPPPPPQPEPSPVETEATPTPSPSTRRAASSPTPRGTAKPPTNPAWSPATPGPPTLPSVSPPTVAEASPSPTTSPTPSPTPTPSPSPTPSPVTPSTPTPVPTPTRASALPPSHVFRPGDPGIVPPVCERCPALPYAAIAQRLGLTGDVTLDVVVDEQGLVASVDFVEGEKRLREGAIKGVKLWRYRPGTKDRVPVKVRVRVRVRFGD